MKLRNIILFLLLFFAFTIITYSQDSSQIKRLEKRTDSLGIDLNKRIELWEKVFTAESNSISRLSNILQIAGYVLTVFLVGVAFFGFSSKREAKKEYNELKKDIIGDKRKLTDQMEKFESMKTNISALNISIEELKENFETISKAKENIEKLKIDIDETISIKNIPAYPEYPLEITRNKISEAQFLLKTYEILGLSLKNEMYYFLGLSFFYRNDYEHANEYFLKIGDQFEYNILCKLLKGICYNRIGKKKEADECFRGVIIKDWKFLRAHKYLIESSDFNYNPGEDSNLATKERLVQIILYKIYNAEFDDPDDFDPALIESELKMLSGKYDKDNLLVTQLKQQFDLRRLSYWGALTPEEESNAEALIVNKMTQILKADTTRYLNLDDILQNRNTELDQIIRKHPDLKTFELI